MRTSSTVIAVAALAFLGACSRTESGDVVVKRPVSFDVKTTPDTIRIPGLGSTRDTTRPPAVGKKETISGTTKDTIIGTRVDTTIVKKPGVSSKKTGVKSSQAKTR